MSIEKAEQIIENHPLTQQNSKFQLSNFILGKELTIQGKMWQCVREIGSRVSSIKAMKLQIEDVEDSIALIDIKKEKLDLQYKRTESIEEREETWQEERQVFKREIELKKRKYERQKQSALSSIDEVRRLMTQTEEELNFFNQAFEHLKKRGDWKDFDDTQAQAEYWNAKLTYELAMRVRLNRPIDIDLAKTIDSLNYNLPVKEQLYLIENAFKKIEKE